MHPSGNRGWMILVVMIGFVFLSASHFVWWWWLLSHPVVSSASSLSSSSSSSMMSSTVALDHHDNNYQNYNNLPNDGDLTLNMKDAMQEAAIDTYHHHDDNNDHQDHRHPTPEDEFHTILHIGPF